MLPEVDPTAVEPAGVIAPVEPEDQLAGRQASTSSWATVSRAVRRSPSGMVGLAILVVLIAVALLAPQIAPYGVNEQVGARLAPPSSAHLLGLDDGGYDTVMLANSVLAADVAAGLAARLEAGLNWAPVDLERRDGELAGKPPALGDPG